MSDVRGARAEGEEKRPLSLLCFFCVRKEVQLQGRSTIEERAEDVDYCLLLLVEVQPPKEVGGRLAACR